MATLYKHGKEIGRIEYAFHAQAWMSDGRILRNDGDGWKVWEKVKEKEKIEEIYKKRLEKKEERDKECPARLEYRKILSNWPLNKRNLIKISFDLLGDDLDGIWSELNDYAGIQIDLEEIEELFNIRKKLKQYRQVLEARKNALKENK